MNTTNNFFDSLKEHLLNYYHFYAISILLSTFSFLLISNFFFKKKKNKKPSKESKFDFFSTILIPIRMIVHLKIFKYFFPSIILILIAKMSTKNLIRRFRIKLETLFQNRKKQNKFLEIFYLSFFLISYIILEHIVNSTEKISINKSTKIIKDHITLYVLNKRTSFFVENERGVILDRLDDCYDKMRELLDFFSDSFDSVITITGFLLNISDFFQNTFIETTKQKITFICLFILYIIVVFFICYPRAKKIAFYSNLYSKSSTKTQQKINDLINNVTHVKNTGLEKEEHQYIKKFTGQEFDFYKNFSKENVLLQFNTNVFSNLPMILISIWAYIAYSTRTINDEQYSTISYLMSFNEITTCLNEFVETYSYQFENANKFYDSLCLFTDNKIENIFDDSIKTKYQISASKKQLKSSKFDIEFIDLLFKDKKNHPILNKINLKIKEGEHIAIVGSSGSGKSTLLNALIRNIEFNSGDIRIGNKDINSYKHHIFFNTISFIPQDNNLFNRTVKENIVLGRKVSKKNLERACKLADCYDLIQTLPDKFNFVVGNGGERLSGGQKQRVVIARNLIKENPNILILDEATSALDLKTEKDVLENILNFYKRQTIIKVSHRLNFLERYKNFKILVMKNGLLVQQGKLNDLIEDQEGAFYQLWKNSRNE